MGYGSGCGFVGRSLWTTTDALVRPPARRPGGRLRARAPAPRNSADDGNLSQVNTNFVDAAASCSLPHKLQQLPSGEFLLRRETEETFFSHGNL